MNARLIEHDRRTAGTPDRALSRLAINRRDAILGAIALSAPELLRSADIRHSIPKVLEYVGRAVGVERVHLLQTQPSGRDARVVDHYLWNEVETPVPSVLRQPFSNLAEIGVDSWVPQLMRGETVMGDTRDFTPLARQFFERAGILSTITVPVFSEERWWGFIAFDACRKRRDWLPVEIDTLKILAELIGAAVTRQRHQQKLADASQIVENSPTVLFRLEPKEPFALSFLSQNIRQYGYDADALLASPGDWLRLFARADHAAILDSARSLASGKVDHSRMEFRLIRADGGMVWLEGQGHGLRDAAGKLVAVEGILLDVTERKHAAEKLRTLARSDALTALPNRVAFMDELQAAFAHAQRGGEGFAVLYLDLDHFKDVNDTLGHPKGDELLQLVAERLLRCVRVTDTVARFGGDEFAILQANVNDMTQIEALARKINAVLSAPIAIGGSQINATASIGVVPYRPDIGDAEAMMSKADLALYRAKAAGRNQHRFHDAALDEEVRDRVEIGRDLFRAVERGQLELVYQPQVKLGTGAIYGVEALLRWHHPERGLVPPSTFIPVAESNGAILPIGRWVIQQACRQLALWRAQGIMLSIAVNVSVAQFKFAGDVDRTVAAALAEHDLPTDALELELTETVLMETTQKYSASFDRLRALGVRLVIDDFGTGFSSLDYLRSFRVSRLKLSASFLEEVATNPDNAAIVRATINLGDALGIDVIAEGVCNVQQREFLIAAGCPLAQGHLFGAPQPADQIAALLRRQS